MKSPHIPNNITAKFIFGTDNGTNGTDKTHGIIVNTMESGTDDVLGTNSGTNIRANGTNNVTNGNPDVTNNVTNGNPDVTNNVTNGNPDVTNNDIRKEAIIEMMRRNKRISVTQIAKELKVTRRTIFRIIDNLKSQNRIKRVGDLKSGTWEVIDQV